MSERALDGIRVIEIGGVAGEWCGKLLADMGAEVIKIEPPEGAASRHIGPYLDDMPHLDRSLYFWHYNTNKQSVTLDLNSEPGLAALHRLLETADVLLETLEPGEADALDIDYASVSAANPRIVHVAISPFGQDGPYVDDGLFSNDLIAMALGGPMQSCGYDAAEGLPPIRPAPDHSHHTASHYACISVLAALWEREAEGRGQYIDVSIQASLAVTVEFANLYWEYERGDVIRQTGRHAYPRETARTQYICADGKPINLAIPLEEKAWLRLVAYLRAEGLGEGLEQAAGDAATRLEHGGAILSALEVLTAQHTAEELFHAGQRLGLTWGAVRAPEEWLDDPHAAARGYFTPVEHPELGRAITYPGAPYKFSETPWRIARRAPLLGEDTARVLADAGVSTGDIAALTSTSDTAAASPRGE